MRIHVLSRFHPHTTPVTPTQSSPSSWRYDLNFYNNFLTNNFHIPEDDKYIIVRPSFELDWDPKKVLDVIEDVKSNLNVDDDRVHNRL